MKAGARQPDEASKRVYPLIRGAQLESFLNGTVELEGSTWQSYVFFYNKHHAPRTLDKLRTLLRENEGAEALPRLVMPGMPSETHDVFYARMFGNQFYDPDAGIVLYTIYQRWAYWMQPLADVALDRQLPDDMSGREARKIYLRGILSCPYERYIHDTGQDLVDEVQNQENVLAFMEIVRHTNHVDYLNRLYWLNDHIIEKRARSQ